MYKVNNLTLVGVYKVPYFLPGAGGEFFKSVGEKYQVMMRGREYYGCGEEYNMEIRKKGSKIIFVPVGKDIKRDRGRKFSGRKSRFKIGVGKNLKLYGFLHTYGR